jgi:catechol 2,3-dioxygenase-like lactoylglutathione lyase family enzyme
MAVELNHTIVWCSDKMRSSAFLARMLGRPAPTPFLHFMVVELDNGVSLDFMEKPGAVARQHYAFLITDEDFDAVLTRIHSEELTFWADPARLKPGEINHHFGGRGVYFEDPDGHLLEVITRPYSAELLEEEQAAAS